MGGRSGSEYDQSWWSEELKPEDAVYKYLFDVKCVLPTGYHRDNPAITLIPRSLSWRPSPSARKPSISSSWPRYWYMV